MKQIKKVEKIFDLADRKKSVYDSYAKRHIPAAMVQNYPARFLRILVRMGRLYVYIPKNKKGGSSGRHKK